SAFARSRYLGTTYFGHLITPNTDQEWHDVYNGFVNYLGVAGDCLNAVFTEGPEAGSPVNFFGRSCTSPSCTGLDRLVSEGPFAYSARSEVIACATGCSNNGNGFTVEYEPDLTPPVSGVVYPIGGEVLGVGTSKQLEWSAADKWAGLATVDLDLSRSGPGGPFEPIAHLSFASSPPPTDSTGSYQWTVTGPETNQGFLRVTAT